MKNFKKTCYTIIGLVSILGLCFVAICFLYPSLTGKNDQDNPPIAGENSDSDSLQKAHDALEGTVIESSALIAEATQESGFVAESNAGPSQESTAAASESNTTASQESAATASSAASESSSASQESKTTASSAASESSSASQESKATASSAASESSSASQESKATASSAASESSSASQESTAASSAAESSSASQESSAAAANQEIIVDGHKDQSAPVFLSFTSSPQIKVGNDFNIHKYIGYADDVDRNVDLEVTGTVDTSKEGTYPLTIVLRDDAGHKTTKEMKVQVVTKTSSSSGSSKKEAFSDFVKNYKRI